ncbi:MAG: ABC transporter permease [Planctomycetes bacterium]|nr:ABC transporter permease [Planctomycetota bacterium]
MGSNISAERIWSILKKELILALRSPQMRAIIIAVPIIQLVIFGYALTMDVKDVSIAVLDRDKSSLSREYISRFDNSPYFNLTNIIKSDKEATELLNRSKADLVLIIDNKFHSDLISGKTVQVQALVDGTDSNYASILLNYAARITSKFSMETLKTNAMKMGKNMNSVVGIELEQRALYNIQLDSQIFFIPGLIMMLLTLIVLLLTSMAIVREKEIGTIEQIMVTPVKPVELIIGKTLPFGLVGLFDATVVVLIAIFWFEVPFKGSILLLYLGISLFLLTALGIGLFISTVSRTQQQALITTFFFLMPGMLLSGFAFPIANMPEFIQWITYLNPLRYFLEILRYIFLKGVGMDILWDRFLALGLIAGFVLTVTVARFKKKLQ